MLALDFVVKNAEKNAVNGETDYMNTDGLLTCGICHTPKQVRVPYFGSTPLGCMCACESRRYDEEQAALQAMQDEVTVERMRGEAFQNVKLRSHTFANDDGANPELSETARRYAQRFEAIRQENCGLLLYGEPGTGKSFYAACIVNALVDRKVSAFMTNITEITKLCDAVQREAILRKIAHCELVVIDDIGSERGTEYALEQVYAAIDTRYRSGKPLIVTTNYTPQTLMESTSLEYRRIYDRIQENCTPIEVKGVRRKNAGRNKAKTLTAILYGDR